MSEGATPAPAPAAEAAAQTPPAPSGETAPAPAPAAEPAPSFVQTAQAVPTAQPAPAEPQHAPKPELVSGDWREMIPVELRQDPTWNKYHSPEQAFRGLVEAQKLIGKKEIPTGLVKPSEEAPKEDWSNYRLELGKMLGVPDSAERYEVPEAAKELNGLDTLMQIAHRSGLGNEQFSSMIEAVAQADKAHMEQMEQAKIQNLQILQDEWGQSYEQNLQIADIGLNAVDPEGAMRQLLDDTGLNTHPAVIKHYHEIGALFREGNFTSGVQPSKETTLEKIEELKRSDAYWEQGLDGGRTRQEVDRLMKEAGLRQ